MQFMAIMAHQRSGTHFLGSAIASHPQIKYTGEIFCRNVPQNEAQMRAGILRVACGAEVICLDCKYNQISPPLEAFLNKPEVKVIHLVRRDRLAAYFSGALQTWRGQHPDADHVPTLCFILDQYRAIEEEVERHKHRLGYLTDLKLYYEDLTNNRDTTSMPPWASRMICDLIGVEHKPLTMPPGKEAPVRYLEYLQGVPDNIIDQAMQANRPEASGR